MSRKSRRSRKRRRRRPVCQAVWCRAVTTARMRASRSEGVEASQPMAAIFEVGGRAPPRRRSSRDPARRRRWSRLDRATGAGVASCRAATNPGPGGRAESPSAAIASAASPWAERCARHPPRELHRAVPEGHHAARTTGARSVPPSSDDRRRARPGAGRIERLERAHGATPGETQPLPRVSGWATPARRRTLRPR